MNCDEKITRRQATTPTVVKIGSVQVLYPRDVQGGTWIAASSRGIAFALLNWNDSGVVQPKTRSRGCVIPALMGCKSIRNADAILKRFDFQGILPFRLVGLFPSERQMAEWR